MGTKLADAYVQIIPSAKGISGKLQEVMEPEAKAAGQSAGETIGSQIGSFVVKAIAALGIGKMISDSITNGMDFETSMAKASTLFSGTSEELADLQGRLVDISSATGVSASALAEAAYSAESASVPMGNLGDMIESSSKLATAGFTDIDTALSATAKTMNAYGMMSDDVAATQENMEKVQRILIQTQNKGITTVGELGSSLAQVTPTAAAFSVSFEQVGASLAGMTAQGTPTAQATTQLNSLIAELGKEGTIASKNLQEAAKGTEYAGMSFTEMMEHGADLNDVLGLMEGLADKNNLAMVDMFSSIEAGKAAMSITNSDWQGNMEAMATEADVVGEAFSTMSDTASFKLGALKETLTNMGIEAFAASADLVSGALDGIKQIVDFIQPSLENLGSAFGGLIEAFAQVAGNALGLEGDFSLVDTVAAALKGTIDGLTSVIQFLTDNMEIIVPIVAGVVAGFVAFKAAMAISAIIQGVTGAMAALNAVMAANPIGAVITIIVGLVAAIVTLWNTNEDFREAVTAAWEAIKKVAGAVFEAVGDFFTGLGETISDIAGAIGETMENVGQVISMVWDAIVSFLANTFANIANTVQSVWNGILNTISTIMSTISNTISNIWNTITGIVSTVVNSIFSAVSGAFNNIVSAVGGAMGAVFDTVSDIIGGIWDAFTGLVDAAISWGADLIGNFLDGIMGAAGALWDGICDIGAGIVDFLGFSEPDKGPLSNFHTFAPDMMKLFAQGIDQNMGLVENSVDNVGNMIAETLANDMSASELNIAADGRGAENINMGGVTIQVYGAQGQDERVLAQKVAEILDRQVINTRMAFA